VPRSTVTICFLSRGVPERFAALLELVRPAADEIVVAVDERGDVTARIAELADTLVTFPFTDPPERALAWLHSLCRCDWVLRLDDDEVPSPALLAALGDRDESLTHAWVPRRWLWEDGYLADDPWTPDWQLRLVRRDAARFPGRVHIPVQADGPHAYLDAPLYHLDLVENDYAERAAKARRYERLRPGVRLGGMPLNVAYYLPELHERLAVAPLPAEDAAVVAHVRAGVPAGASSHPVRRATRAEIDAHWTEAPLADSDYSARIDIGPPPSPVAGEIREVDVRVTNLGGATWPGGLHALPEIRLSYRWDGVELLDEQFRTALPHDVHPGETVLVPLAFHAPDSAGAHELVVDLVQERHRWFGVDARATVEVRARRRAAVVVTQPPGDAEYDQLVDELLAGLDPELEPVLVGPKEDWLRDRFGTAAASRRPRDAERVYVVRRSEPRGLHVFTRAAFSLALGGLLGLERLH